MTDSHGTRVDPKPQFESKFDRDKELDTLIHFHRGWKQFSSYASFIGSALSIVSAAAATVVAGLGYAAAAAIVAALATIFTSLEKVLQFRERWDLHRLMESDLDQLRLEAASNLLTDAQVVERIGRIREDYSDRMSSFRVLSDARTSSVSGQGQGAI